MECPGAGLRAGFRVGGPAPGKESTFPGKPRNPDESFQAHVTHLVEETCFLKVSRDRRHGPDQNIAKARIINPNMATATIAFVAVSIVASVVMMRGHFSGCFLKRTICGRRHCRG